MTTAAEVCEQKISLSKVISYVLISFVTKNCYTAAAYARLNYLYDKHTAK